MLFGRQVAVTLSHQVYIVFHRLQFKWGSLGVVHTPAIIVNMVFQRAQCLPCGVY